MRLAGRRTFSGWSRRRGLAASWRRKRRPRRRPRQGRRLFRPEIGASLSCLWPFALRRELWGGTENAQERKHPPPNLGEHELKVKAGEINGGEGGIRTRGPGLSQGKRLAGVPDRPLQHLSAVRKRGVILA